ncbi:MAG: hypothetical protein IMF19_14495 [Proteobacteria bacterium]|nr:hypothetical protein [Pseudomonadota bacterium]
MNDKKVEREHKVYELDENADVELKINKKFPYQKMLDILTKGNTFFLAVERRSAAYARKNLERELGELIETTFSVYTTPEGEKLDGYVFSFKLVKDYLEKVHVEDTFEEIDKQQVDHDSKRNITC